MRTKKAIKNAAVSSIYMICSVVCGLITPRLILSAFGSTYNGVISSASQFLEIISLLTIGIAGATRVALYNPIAEGDILAISRIIKSNKVYMRKVAIVIAFFSIILCFIYPKVSHNDLSNIESAALIAIVAIGSFSNYFFGISNQTLLSADQSSYIYYSIQSLAIIANTVIVVALIQIGCSIYIVKLGSAVVFFLSPVILNHYVKKKYMLIDDCEPDDKAIKNRGAVAFHSIANIIHEDTDIIVLTLFVDAKLISVYAIYQLVIGKVRTLLLLFTQGLEGAFGNMWAKGEMDAFKRNFRLFEFLMFSFTSIVFSCVAVLIIPFIALYTKNVSDINYIRVGFAVLTVITEAIYCIRHPYLIIVQATGNYVGTKKAALYEAIINICLSLVLVNFWGLNGVVFGTLVANIFRAVHYAIYISNHIISGSIIGSIARVVWFIINSIIIIVIQSRAIKLFSNNYEWFSWVIMGIISLVIALFITCVSSMIFFRKDIKKLMNIFMIKNKRCRGMNK